MVSFKGIADLAKQSSSTSCCVIVVCGHRCMSTIARKKQNNAAEGASAFLLFQGLIDVVLRPACIALPPFSPTHRFVMG